MTDALETCPDCGTPLVYTGPPIHEDYCPNTECDREKRLMRKNVQKIREALSDDRERRAYQRGLEDAGAAIRNACNCDFALDAIRALAKVADDHTPVKHTTASASYVRGRAIAAAIRARAKEGGE